MSSSKRFLAMMMLAMNKIQSRNSVDTFVLVELKLIIQLVNCKIEICNNDYKNAGFRGRVISCST